MQLQMAVVNGFANFCLREKTPPSRVKIVNFGFDPNAVPLPTISFRCVKSIEVGVVLEHPGQRKHERDKVWDMGEDKFQTDFTRDWHQMLASCVEDCPALFDILCDIAKVFKSYCDFKQYKFETVTIDPSHPPIMIPGDNTMKICLQVTGVVMAPEPVALQEVGSGI